jgi:hypothetical protein
MMAQAGVIHIEAKTKGKGRLCRLTTAGEDFRPIVELLSIWGQRWGQGLIGPDDLDPGMLVRGMRGNTSGGALSSAFFAAYRNRAAALGIGGWCSGPKRLRFVSKLRRRRHCG